MFRFKHSIFILSTVLLISVLTASAQAQDISPNQVLPASPKSATLFYPNLAEIREEHKLPGNLAANQDGTIDVSIYLPGRAHTQSLAVNYSGGRVLALHSEALQPFEADPILDALRAKFETARQEEQALAAQLAGVQARINTWNNPPAPQADIAAELEKLDAAREKYVPILVGQALELEEQHRQAQEKLTWLENELNNHSPSWKVNMTLLREQTGQHVLAYNYLLDGCGWQPVYRLEALPDSEKVHFAMNAEIWQHSGLDWETTELSLATVPPGMSLEPGQIWPWQITPHSQVDARQRAYASGTMMAEEAPMMDSMDMSLNSLSKSYTPPVEVQRSTFAVWELGPKNLLSGQTSAVSILEEDWTAEFSVTLRPQAGRQGYLTAVVQAGKTARNLPDGQGMFLVDNTSVGQGYFSPLAENPVFFGQDPLVYADMVLLDSQTDETGLISKDQTKTWDWRITVQNKRKVEIPVRVEDAKPIPGDARIKLTLTSTPAPEVDGEKQLYFWEQTMAPESEWIIEHKLKITAPADLPLTSSR